MLRGTCHEYEANPANGQLKQDVSIPTFHAWREGAPSIESAALFSRSNARFIAGVDAPPVTTMSVSPGFFAVRHSPADRSRLQARVGVYAIHGR